MTQNNSSVLEILDRMKAVLNVTKDVDLATHLGGGQPSVWKRRGAVPMSVCVTFAIEKGVSLDWLVLGRESKSSEEGEGEMVDSVKEPEYVDVPVFVMPGLVESDQDVWWRLPRATVQSFGVEMSDAMVMKVAGDGNFGDFRAGDIVLVDRRPRDVDGVFVLRFGDHVRVKRVQAMSNGSMKLSSDSEMYEPEYIDAESFREIEVIGFCAGILSRIY